MCWSLEELCLIELGSVTALEQAVGCSGEELAAAIMISGVGKDSMIIRAHHFSIVGFLPKKIEVLIAENGDFSNHGFDQVISPCVSRFWSRQTVRKLPLFASSAPRALSRRSSVPTARFPLSRSGHYSAAEAAVSWRIRVSEGSESIETEGSVQHGKLTKCVEGEDFSNDRGLRWENNALGELDERAASIPTAGPGHDIGTASSLQDVAARICETSLCEDGTFKPTSGKFELQNTANKADIAVLNVDDRAGSNASSILLSEAEMKEEPFLGEDIQQWVSNVSQVGTAVGSFLVDKELQREQRVSDASKGSSSGKLFAKEMDLAVRAVQLACMLSQRTQQRVLHQKETADQKKDRSLVTVADWGVQAVVSWVLSQGVNGEEFDLVAEEDTTGLRGREKADLLQRVVSAVNECLQEAGIVGITPPHQALGALDVLRIIGKGNADGGKSGRYWVLDPVDGTLGFVRGDQYAIALALIEDGEVVLAVLGCPNFPLRKQWLRYHHRYFRLASKLHPPSPSEWHKGIILTTTKGAAQVNMLPLVVDADGNALLDGNLQAPQIISVSTIDDPAQATFCEPFENSNTSHSFTAGLAQSLGLRNRPLRVYSLAKYAAIARGDAEIFMKFAKAGYKEKIWDHAAGVLIVQEAGGVVTDAAGRPLDFSQGRFLTGLDRGIIACAGKTLHDKLLTAVDASWNSSTL